MLTSFSIALAVAAGLAVLAWRYFNERSELRRVRELFSRYVPQEAVDEILARRDRHLLWAQRRYATVVCARIRNFGFFAEELGAEETLAHLNEFYAVAGRAIVRHGGIIERLHADGITAVFGVLASENFHEEHALRAALRIIRLANAMNARWKPLGRRPFEVYTGINSGNVVAGEVGFAQRREFAVVGNPATVASRLQQAAEDLNAPILASASTFEPVRELFNAIAVDALPLAGMRRLQRAYMIRGTSPRRREEPLHLAAEIPALQTVIAGAPASQEEPAPMHARAFSQFDDAVAALPDPPALTGEYEGPRLSAEAPLPPHPAVPHRSANSTPSHPD